MTLLQLIKTIKRVSLSIPNVNSVVDEFLDLNDVTAKYSSVILQQRTHRRNNDFMVFSFYLGYSDRLTENKDNEVEVQSTAIQVIDDIVYKLENLNFDCTVGVYNTFTQRFLAEAAGGYVELDIVVPMGECEDDFVEEKLDTTITANGEYNFIPKGLGYQSVHLNVDVAHLQDKSLDITKNGNYKVQYDKGFSGLKTVDVSVNVPVPEINNQEKSITITENGQTDITPDTNYTGLSRVSVNVNIDTQSYYDNGYSQGKIDGKTEGIAEQKAKLTDIEIVENGVYERTDGYKKVEVNVPSPVIDLRETEITPETTEQIITPDGFDGYNRITVKGVDSSIDSDIKPENIKSGVNILGVEGNLEGVNNQEKSITINSNGSSSVVPDNGYTGISKVDITVNVPTSGGDGIDLTSLGYTAQENTKINTDIQDSIAYSQSLLENYTNSTSYANDKRITFAPLFPCSKRKSFYQMFNYCTSLTTIPALDTSSGTNFSGMFSFCHSLKFVPQLDTSKNTDFSYLFNSCESLTSIPALDTKKGDDFSYMFAYCQLLSSIPYLDTSNSTNFSFMFGECKSLSTIPEINVTKGYDFNCMFINCSSLVSIGKLNSIIGSDFTNMFFGCKKLKTISLINISNTENKLNLSYMFAHCNLLTNITFEGSINADISFYDTKILTYNSIKSILTACAATTNTNSKTVTFNQSIQDQNNELTNLVASCTEKGWAISGLTITTA